MPNKFTQNDITPSVFSSGLKEAIDKDVKWLTDKKQSFIEVPCPACGGRNYSIGFKKYGFDFAKCKTCRTVFMNPRASADILKDFYFHSAVYRYWNDYIFPASEKVRGQKILATRVQRITEICDKLSVPTDCLVEVGPGFGTFCQRIKQTKKFNNVIAIEPSPSLAESCRKKGIEIIQKPIEGIERFRVKPNVIVAFEVIEHLFSPENFLVKCRHLMEDDSVIAVTCPNFLGFDISVLGLASESIDHEHINLFNPESLKQLFTRCGFEVIECFTPGEIDGDIVRSKVLAGQYDISQQPFLKTVLIEQWDKLGGEFQKFLQQNNLSSHMWLAAKKVKTDL